MNIRLVVDNTAPRLTDEELEDALFDYDKFYNERTDGRNNAVLQLAADRITENDRRAMARWFGGEK